MMLAAMLAVAVPVAPAAAQTPPAAAPAVTPSPALKSRIDGLVAILNGGGDYDGFFSTAFRAQVSKQQFDQVGAQLKGQVGVAVAVETIVASGPYEAIVTVGYERGIATVRIVVDPTAPHTVTGMLLTKVEPRNDNAARIEADFRALPGKVVYGVYALDDGVKPVMEMGGTTVGPLGSAFKLWILAEAARQVKAGTRKWTDIVILGDRSLPSGITQKWPPNAPVTLHTLATLMISISDNTATDALLNTLGRDKVDAMVALSGVADPAATTPVLSTIDAFRLKHAGNADLIANWATLTPAARRQLLADNDARLRASKFDAAMFGDKPLSLQIEWFASPRDEARVLDWIRLNGGPEALAILAVNPGLPDPERFAYAGFKGGSEPGVIWGSFLIQTRAGKWYAVTGGWSNPAAAVETLPFISMMGRAAALVEKR
jgi:hypothetical protein